ncbi:MAG: metalloregulator ArsR/SmtB family transcription factor [Candidatus Wallbacteria bacterium]|nr:metalloregulator ArsR/SmtB family transcription factor [Candidatus Wallbacteria bacterium]
MSSRKPRELFYEQFARIGKAVSSPRRLELLEMLAQAERTVEALAAVTGQPVANVSHHLQALRHAGLVQARKEGLWVHYSLAGGDVFELFRLIRTLAARHLAEVDRIVQSLLESRDRLEPVTREELLRRSRAGTVFVLDVRPAEEYAAGHLPGAVSIPLKELEQRMALLPPDMEIVAYCRGPYCVMAYEAVRMLRSKGKRARRLDDGFPEWKAQGLSVEKSGGAGTKAGAARQRSRQRMKSSC